MIKHLNSTSLRYFDKYCNRKCQISTGAIIGAAAISAAAGIGGGIMQNRGSRGSQRRAYNYTRMLNEQQNQYAIENWNKQNEYNLPKNIVQRLKDAGINPAMYLNGNGSATGTAGPINTPSSANMPMTDYVNPLSGLPSIAEKAIRDYYMAQTSNKDLEIKDAQITQEKYKAEYMAMYNNYWRDYGFPNQESEAQLNQFNNQTHLNVGSADDLIYNDAGLPEGYFDQNNNIHHFNQSEQALAIDLLGHKLQYQTDVQNAQLSVEQNKKNLTLAESQNSAVLAQIQNSKELTKAEVKHLRASAAHLFQLAHNLNYDYEQLKASEQNGKNVNIRIMELQEREKQLSNAILDFEKQYTEKYGKSAYIMQNVVSPVITSVTQVAASFYAVGKGYQALRMGKESSRLGSIQNSQPNFSNMPNPYGQQTVSYP